MEKNRSDEEISDDGLDIGMQDLSDLLITKPGGRRGTCKKEADDHHENALAAIAHAQRIWQIPDQGLTVSTAQKIPTSF